jgi:hypothetical protein
VNFIGVLLGSVERGATLFICPLDLRRFFSKARTELYEWAQHTARTAAGLTFLSFFTSLQVLMRISRNNLLLTVMIHRITNKKPDDLAVLQAISAVVPNKFPLPADSAVQMGSLVE